MTRKIMVFIAAALLAVSVYAAGDDAALASFVKKAGIAEKDIQEAGLKMDRLRADYRATTAGIEAAKNSMPEKGFFRLIAQLKLRYMLGRGNSLGYRIYRLEDGIRELKIEHFTYASLAAEEYGDRIRECHKSGCKNMKEYAEKRIEWAAAAEKYGDFLQIDLSSMKLIKDFGKRAEKDIKDYLGKKLVQAEQRIYMLEEEKGLLIILSKAGLSGPLDRKKNEEKIRDLKKLKSTLQSELDKIR